MVEAFARASVVSAGPWIMTVITLGIVMIFGKELMPLQLALDFQSIIIYNFCFTLVLTAPLSLPSTRYLADSIYIQDVSNTPGMVTGALALVYAVQAPLAIWFYYFYANFSFFVASFAIFNGLLISTIWMLSIFVTALSDYYSVTRGFLYGMSVALILTLIGSLYRQETFMLIGFNIGLGIIVAYLAAQVLAEYPYLYRDPFAFLSSFWRYKELMLSGLIYNSAIWVDKWVMWSAPEAIRLPNNLVLYPHYDSAAFLAYLTTIPAMALFLINIETEFFEKYLRFYEEVRRGATFRKIVENQQELRRVLLIHSRNALILQITIGILVIVATPQIFKLLNINFIEEGMFDLLVVGASYQVLVLFITIILWYFDNRKKVLLLHAVYLITNFAFTWIAMGLGFTYYGLGFAASALLTFLLAAFLVEEEIKNLPYRTFVANNRSINRY